MVKGSKSFYFFIPNQRRPGFPWSFASFSSDAEATAMHGWASLEDKILYVRGPGCKRTKRNRSKQQRNGGKKRMNEPRDGSREGTSVSAAPRRPHQDLVHDPAHPAAAR